MVICEAKIIDGKICEVEKSIKNPTSVSNEKFEKLVEGLDNYFLYVEGVEESGYDNSDDDRAGCSRSRWPFRYYYEIEPRENSKHLLVIDGKVAGVVFFIRKGYSDVYYKPFLFDNSITNSIRLGYSASHSSNFTYIEKVSLVKKGENGLPETGKTISFILSESSTSI